MSIDFTMDTMTWLIIAYWGYRAAKGLIALAAEIATSLADRRQERHHVD